MTLRGKLLGETLISMPEGLKIKIICVKSSKQAKNQDSGLLVRISRQATETSEFSKKICSGAFNDLEI